MKVKYKEVKDERLRWGLIINLLFHWKRIKQGPQGYL